MGQVGFGIAFHADTPVNDGLTSVVSETIEELSPDEFWAVLAMDLRNRRRFLYETDKAQDAWDHVDEGDLLVQDPNTRDYLVWHLDRERDVAVVEYFGGDATLRTPRWRGNLRVHRQPFQIEFWITALGQRESGGALKGLMLRLLKTMNSRAGCAQDVDGLDEDGRKSVVSDPIVDSILSPDMFWRQTKELIKKRAVETMPDGSVVQRKSEGWSEFWPSSSSTYTRHVFLEKRKEIVSYTYNDSSMSDSCLERARHLRIHERPYRLEMWTASPDRRLSGPAQRDQMLALLEPILEQVHLISRGPSIGMEANVRDILKLRKEVSFLRTEVFGALASLGDDAMGMQVVCPGSRRAP